MSKESEIAKLTLEMARVREELHMTKHQLVKTESELTSTKAELHRVREKEKARAASNRGLSVIAHRMIDIVAGNENGMRIVDDPQLVRW
jgi:hypothetical protein